MNPRGKKNIEQIANSVIRHRRSAAGLGDAEFAIKPSIGIAIYPWDGVSGDELIANADAAMYAAKTHTRGIAFFDSQEARGMSA